MLLRPSQRNGLSGLGDGGAEGESTEGEQGQQTVEEVEVEEARTPRVPHDPGRPTRKELAEHLCIHWPFRSWCRHCVCGRAVASPHKSRTDEDREFGRGRVPTISLDHCFLGSKEGEDESAHRNPFLAVYDNETEGRDICGGCCLESNETVDC